MKAPLYLMVLAVWLVSMGEMLWPTPRISATRIGAHGAQVCAPCPRFFKNNVTWVSDSALSDAQQMAEYVNDAVQGYCTIDWHWLRTGKVSYEN